MILHKTTLILLPLLAKTAFPVTFYTEMHFLALLSPLNGQGWTVGLSLFLIVSPAQLGHWCEKFSDLFHLCIEQQKWNPPFFCASTLVFHMSCHGFQSLHATLIYFFRKCRLLSPINKIDKVLIAACRKD